MSLSVIILAAGKGTRMKSDLPKPLHEIRGRSLLAWVLKALEGSSIDDIAVVVGHGRNQVVESLMSSFDRPFHFAEQLSQRGTGDAAAVGLSELDLHDNSFSENDHVLVLPGDTPMLTSETVAALIDAHLQSGAAATVVTALVEDPTGYGRIQRNSSGGVDSIIEHRDASTEQLAINEINSSMYCFRRSLLAPALRMISTDNAQGEMYLTDAIGVLAEAGHPVLPFVTDASEIAGVNDRAQLSEAAEQLATRIAEGHMRAGVTIVQPSSTVIGADVTIEPDVLIHASTVLEGTTTIDAGCVIGPHAYLVDASIGAGATVVSSAIWGTSVAAGQTVGPNAHLTPETRTN